MFTTPDLIPATESAGRKDLKGAQEQHLVSKTLHHHWKTTPSMTKGNALKPLKLVNVIISTESKLPEGYQFEINKPKMVLDFRKT